MSQIQDNYFPQNEESAKCQCLKPADHVQLIPNRNFKYLLCKQCVEKQVYKEYVPIKDYDNKYREQYKQKNKQLCEMQYNIEQFEKSLENSKKLIEEIKSITTEEQNRMKQIDQQLQRTKGGYISITMYNQLQQFLNDPKLNQRAENITKEMKEVEKIYKIKQSRVDVNEFSKQFEVVFTKDALRDILFELKVFENAIASKISKIIESFVYSEIHLAAKLVGDINKTINDEKNLYQGYVIVNKKHGCGIYLNKEKKFIYCGVFENDEFFWGIKLVVISAHQYQMYKGYFQNNEISGIGELESLDQKIEHQYKGNFLNGQRHGRGKYVWLNDTKIISEYDGEWRFNKQHGKGIHISNSESKQLQGRFEDGLPVDVQIKDLNTNEIKNFKVQKQEEAKLPFQTKFQTPLLGQPQNNQQRFKTNNQLIQNPTIKPGSFTQNFPPQNNGSNFQPPNTKSTTDAPPQIQFQTVTPVQPNKPQFGVIPVFQNQTRPQTQSQQQLFQQKK